MIIAADANTFAHKLLEKMRQLIEERRGFLETGQGIVDFPSYRFEIGMIDGIRSVEKLMTLVAQELSDPHSKKEAA